jgi:hypothetical protein
MAEAVYFLGVLVTAVCAWLLLRAYAGSGRRLLLWSGLCFAGLTVSNILMFVDLVILRDDASLYTWRLSTAAVSMLLLVYGLIMESD